jgi:tetratricopeptide (TPR) repeat protein
MKFASVVLLGIVLGAGLDPVRGGTEPRAGSKQTDQEPGPDQVYGSENKIPVTTSSSDALKDFLIGRDLLEKLRARDSRPFFEKAIEADRGFAMGYLYLSFVEANTEKARINIDIAFTLANKVSEGERLWITGVKAGAAGFPLKQRGYFKKLVHLYPEDERARTLLGNTYFAQQEFDPATEQYEKALTIAPGYSPPYNQLGYAYSFQGDYARAEKIFRKYIDLIPDDPNPYDSYAELLMKMGKYDESIETYRRALAVNPGFINSYRLESQSQGRVHRGPQAAGETVRRGAERWRAPHGSFCHGGVVHRRGEHRPGSRAAHEAIRPGRDE